VPHLEKAAELMPVDPIINDHLGDVYWAVGRKREARFQWSRALSFDPEGVDIIRIRKKLQIGLDNVLIEEGSKPLELSNSND
jgi:predicted negative regulator of RcsB-dependent stress response